MIHRFPRTKPRRFPRTKKPTRYQNWLNTPSNPKLVPIRMVRAGSQFLYEYGFKGELRMGRLYECNSVGAYVEANGKDTHWSADAPVIPILRFPRKPKRFPRTKIRRFPRKP